MKLDRLGWNDYYRSLFSQYNTEKYIAGRVSVEHKNSYRVLTEYGELLAEVTGKFNYRAESRVDYPAVGDWVVLELHPGQNRGSIHAVLSRKSKFIRKMAGRKTDEQILAANIDTIFIVSSLNSDFNLRRLERYLTQVWDSGASPVIVLNKADLCDDVEDKVRGVEEIAFAVPIHAVSCLDNTGLDQLNNYLGKGETIALIGSSGVGKSSIINILMGEELQLTGDIREDGKGRHTTTHRELMILPSGAIIIDTPGMRELQLWDEGDGLSGTFADIEELAVQCKFNDCKHDTEPGCAVKNAIKSGSLNPKRLQSYRKMLRELKYLEMKKTEIEKYKWKTIYGK
ncbi:MAG: ribosome small subunit-dependent GTPase A [Halanaerobiales bacterium]